jgi:hypothetical protein
VWWKWAALAAAALLAVFFLWFFVFRGGNSSPATPPAPPPRFSLGKTISYDAYLSAVDRALSDLSEARTDPSQKTAKLNDAANALEQVEGASISGAPGGDNPVQVDNTALTVELRSKDPNPAAVEAALAALSAELHTQKAGIQSGTQPGEQAKADLRSVLSDPAFNYEHDLTPVQRLQRWLASLTGNADPGDTLWRWLLALVSGVAVGILVFLFSERLGNRWARLGLAVVGGLITAAVVLYGTAQLDLLFEVLAAVGLVVAAVAAGLLLSGVYRSSAPPARPRPVSELAEVLGMGSTEAKRRAEEAAAAGDYRSAIRFRTLAVLLTLDESGQLVFDRAATDREYLFRAPGPLQADLQPMLDRFSAVWYGEAPAGPEEWRDTNEHGTHLEAMSAAQARAARQQTSDKRSAA